MLEIIENKSAKYIIVRQEFNNYDINLWISSINVKSLQAKNINIDEFYKKHTEGLIPLNKDINIFYISKVNELSDFIDKLESDGYKNIKETDIYILNSDNILEKVK